MVDTGDPPLRDPEVSAAPGRRSVLVVWRHAVTDPAAAARHEAVLAERLCRLYRPFLGPRTRATARTVVGAGCTVALVEESGAREALRDLVVWGDPIGAAGPASGDELRAALADDGACRRLLGAFVLVGVRGDRLVVRNSSDLVHSLKHSSGRDGEAWATQGLAALVATGRRPSVVAERLPELVLYDFVFGDDELLDGVRVLPEASTLRVGAEEAEESSYWPVGDRLRGGHGDAQQLRSVLVETLTRLTNREGLVLALTAGRDSTLLASCLAEAGRALPCYTIGNARTPDGAGAAAVAAHLAWPHVFVGQQHGGRPSLERLLAGTRWSEGQDTAWNFYPPPLDYGSVPAAAQLNGVGGEMGRALYWSGWTDEALHLDPGTAMSSWIGRELSPDGAALLRARADAFADQLLADGWTGTGVYDAWHARGRVRKWPTRTPPPPGTGLVTVYTNAPVARTLLGIAPEDRDSRRAFDAASALGGDLHGVARRAAALLPGPGRLARSRRVQRVVRKVRPGVGVVLARRCLRDLGVGVPLAAEVLGREWWEAKLAAAPFDPVAWRYVWNVIAVQALVTVAADVATEQAAISR